MSLAPLTCYMAEDRGELMFRLRCLLCATLVACQKDEGSWLPFNWDSDVLTLEVTSSGEPGEALTADLHSTTNTTIVGDVRIEPGSGPVGTEHTVIVTAFPEYEERVDKVEIEVSSELRGELVLPMVQDSAELYRFVLSITSYGVEGEARSDLLTFRMYEFIPAPVTNDGGGIDIIDI